MKKYLLLLPLILISLLIFLPHNFSVYADEIDDLQKQIDVLNKAREQSVAATKPLEGQLDSLRRQLAQIQSSLDNLSASIKQKQKDLEVREDKLALQQVLLDARVRSYYIRSYLADPLLVILSSQHPTELFQELSYRQAATKQDRSVISSITGQVLDLLTQKTKLEKDLVSLASLQAQVDKNAAFLGGEIKKAKDYQSDLSSQIAALSAKQQALIAAKLASLNIPRSAYTTQGGCVDDRGIDPGFSPRFALFTYGVPNRIGLNQYGAKGRAETGQNYESILKAYYNFDWGNSSNPNIHVVGTNNYGQNIDQTLPLEDYLKHIYEMPASWHPEALKAQAIAARSYVLAATNNGASSICPSDSCQEFKQETNASTWADAVNATSGKVMTSGGSPIKAWFSSTHGGYFFSSGDIGWSSTPWTKRGIDTVTGSASSFAQLQSNAYDKGSPWFYCDWGARAGYNKTAWLKPDELADIINVIMLAKKDSGTQNHLSQLDKPNPDGTDTWDSGRVRDELRSRGGTPFSSVSSTSVNFDNGSGQTTSVTISGDSGSQTIDGPTFKSYFNLRAPANIQIVGPLFNVESR